MSTRWQVTLGASWQVLSFDLVGSSFYFQTMTWVHVAATLGTGRSMGASGATIYP